MIDPSCGLSAYRGLTRLELACLARELLLIGQMIDRSGMTWCISEFGREQMTAIAIEEWACASPIYTRRMQEALGFRGHDVPTIFKGLQFDIGAPHQFLDFRFRIQDENHGEFWLDRCGALDDVAPMGEIYIQAMCHDIEDPTFDATAIATNPRAQVRPVFRPPFDAPRDGVVCRWTVVIDDAHLEAQPFPGLAAIRATAAATLALAPIDPAEDGWSDYSGDVLSDIPFESFSHGALVRICDEFAVQMQLLHLSFAQAVRSRCMIDDQLDEALYLSVLRRQFVGIAGAAAARLRDALAIEASQAGAIRMLHWLPMLNPAAYLAHSVEGEAETLVVHLDSPAFRDECSWAHLLLGGWSAALDAAVRAVDPTFTVEIEERDDTLGITVAVGEKTPPAPEVAVMGFSTGVSWRFEERTHLALTPVRAVGGSEATR